VELRLKILAGSDIAQMVIISVGARDHVAAAFEGSIRHHAQTVHTYRTQ